MEANQKKRFVCKFCNKRYPCGKSLGGHIRIHLNGSSNDAIEETNYYFNNQSPSLGGYNGKRDLSGSSEAFLGGQSGYGLRENPKKTKRFVVGFSKPNLLQDKVCKECGKGFQSLKALCGHMASHSRNNNTNNRDSVEDHHSGTSEKLKEIVMDGESDSETSAPSKRTRSERVRYKTRCVYSNSANGSFSCGSDVELEQEQEEVAKCLMMLSKDCSFKGCFSTFDDSSDHDSVVLGTKSLCAKAMRVGKMKGGTDCEFDESGFLEMKKAKGREDVMSLENENDESENSDSGYFNGHGEVRFHFSANGFARDGDLQKQKVEPELGYGGEFGSESGKRLSRFRRVKAAMRKNLVERDSYRLAGRDAMANGSSASPGLASSIDQKRCKSSALGDQRIILAGANGFTNNFKNAGLENAADTNNFPNSVPARNKSIQLGSGKNTITEKAEKKMGSRKGKMYECPFCSRVFRSGQALGGHKRSHFVGSAEDRTLVIKEDMPEISMPALIDLNLPAPTEEQVHGFVPW